MAVPVERLKQARSGSDVRPDLYVVPNAPRILEAAEVVSFAPVTLEQMLISRLGIAALDRFPERDFVVARDAALIDAAVDDDSGELQTLSLSDRESVLAQMLWMRSGNYILIEKYLGANTDSQKYSLMDPVLVTGSPAARAFNEIYEIHDLFDAVCPLTIKQTQVIKKIVKKLYDLKENGISDQDIIAQKGSINKQIREEVDSEVIAGFKDNTLKPIYGQILLRLRKRVPHRAVAQEFGIPPTQIDDLSKDFVLAGLLEPSDKANKKRSADFRQFCDTIKPLTSRMLVDEIASSLQPPSTHSKVAEAIHRMVRIGELNPRDNYAVVRIIRKKDQLRAKIAAMAEDGHEPAEIARITGQSYRVVRNRARRMVDSGEISRFRQSHEAIKATMGILLEEYATLYPGRPVILERFRKDPRLNIGKTIALKTYAELKAGGAIVPPTVKEAIENARELLAGILAEELALGHEVVNLADIKRKYFPWISYPQIIVLFKEIPDSIPKPKLSGNTPRRTVVN